MSGEYFLTKEQKNEKAQEEKREKTEQKKRDRVSRQNALFEAPDEDLPEKPKNKREKKKEEKDSTHSSKPDINDLKNKFLKKSKK